MADDPLDTSNPPVVPSAASRSKIVCEFCECQVTPRGEIIFVGEKAKKYRKHEDLLDAKDAEITRLTNEISALKQERDALRGSGSTSTAAHRAGNRIS